MILLDIQYVRLPLFRTSYRLTWVEHLAGLLTLLFLEASHSSLENTVAVLNVCRMASIAHKATGSGSTLMLSMRSLRWIALSRTSVIRRIPIDLSDAKSDLAGEYCDGQVWYPLRATAIAKSLNFVLVFTCQRDQTFIQ